MVDNLRLIMAEALADGGPLEEETGAVNAVLQALDAHGLVLVERDRVEALFRWLTDEGHMTPVATMQLRKLLNGSET